MPHIHDQIDFTAEVFVVFQNKVLLRIHDKMKFWLSVGGHIELDEDPNHAAIREVKEEVGLDVTLIGQPIRATNEGQEDYHELIAPAFMNRHRISPTHEHITLIFFGRATTDQFRNDDKEHSDGIRWFTSEELDDPQYQIRDNLKHYARAALAAAK